MTILFTSEETPLTNDVSGFEDLNWVNIGKRVMTLKGQRNQCSGCCKYFKSNFAFDKHRTGNFGKDRRCKTTEEMFAAGMAQNAAGWWVTALNPMFANKEEDDEI